jgi:hypothetical protein
MAIFATLSVVMGCGHVGTSMGPVNPSTAAMPMGSTAMTPSNGNLDSAVRRTKPPTVGKSVVMLMFWKIFACVRKSSGNQPG